MEGLLSQDYPNDRYEILVADGNSTDGTTRLVEEIAKTSPVRIKLLPNPKQLSSAGRNVGMRASAGEIVVFIDGHSTYRAEGCSPIRQDSFKKRAQIVCAGPSLLPRPVAPGFRDS